MWFKRGFGMVQSLNEDFSQGSFEGNKGENGNFVGVKKGKMEAFEDSFFHKTARFFTRNNSEGSLKDRGYSGGFKNDRFSKEISLLKAQKHIQPPVCLTKFYRWLTVAPHGDGIFLKVSRILENNLWKQARCLVLDTSFSSLISCYKHERIISTAILPQTTTYPSYYPNIFSSR